MAQTTYEDDEFDDSDDDWNDADDDRTETLVCPNCKGDVFEDAEQCPHCGDWIIPAYAPSGSRRWVWPAAAILVILALLIMTFR